MLAPVALVTLPRSGTMYLHYFFQFLNRLIDPDCQIVLYGGRLYHDLAGLGLRLYAGHSICPGYTGTAEPGELLRWQRLRFSHPNLNNLYPALASLPEHFDPARAPHARIVYVVRHPFEQLASFHGHVLGHKNAALRTVRDHWGIDREIEGLEDFVLSVGLDLFLKQYVSFRTMAAHFPSSVRIVTYHRLMVDPLTVLQDILGFLGRPPGDAFPANLVDQAAKASSRDALAALERQIGESLAADQIDDAASHMRHTGRIDLERALSPTVLDHIRDRLADWSVDPNLFDA